MANRSSASKAAKPKVRPGGPNGASTSGGPAAGKSLLGKIKQFNVWREQFNPLVGLDMARARSLLQFAQRGELADLQWTFKFVEERFPTLFALIERRTSPLLEKEYAVRVTPEEKLPPGSTKEQADAQAKHLANCYQRIDNLKEAMEHAAMASFRGYAHLQKQDKDGDGEVDHFEVLDQWNFVRKGLRGNWFWNPDALQTGWQSLPKENEIQSSGTVQYDENGVAGSLVREDFVIREVKRPIDPIALVAFIGWSLGKKDYRGFIEIFGIPGGVVIGPPNVSPDKETDYQTAGLSIAEGGSGYLPHGSSYVPNDSPRGTNPFKEFLRGEVEDVVLTGTGGLLTMLTEGGSGTLAGTAHTETFDKIARSEAAKISEVFQRDFDKIEIEQNFPGQPVLAFFELVSQDESATDTLKFKRDVFSKFQADGTVGDILANQVDLKQLVRDIELPVNDEYVDPYVPVETQNGRTITGDLVLDAKKDIIGARTEAGPNAALPLPGEPKPGDKLPTMNGGLPVSNRSIQSSAPKAFGGVQRRLRNRALSRTFDELIGNAQGEYDRAQAEAFQPLRERLAEILKLPDFGEQTAALNRLKLDLPGMLKAINASSEAGTVLEQAMNSALAIGATQAAEQTDLHNREVILNGDIPGHDFHGNQWTEADAAEHQTLRSEADRASHAAHVTEFETPAATNAQKAEAHRLAAEKYKAAADHVKARGDAYVNRVTGKMMRQKASDHRLFADYYAKAK